MESRDVAALMVAVEDAKDQSLTEMETVSTTYQPVVDSLKDQAAARRTDAETKRQEARAKRQEAETADKPKPLSDAADTLDAEAVTLDDEAESLNTQADETHRSIRDLRDKTRQLRIVEAVQAQGQCEAMFEDFEIRARHDIPGSQYIAKSITECCDVTCLGDLLNQRVDALKNETAALIGELDSALSA